MKSRKFIVLFSFLSVFLFFAGSVSAQESPIYLRQVQPPEGRAGQTIELILLGGGFSRVQEVSVQIEGVEVFEVRVESDEVIRANIFIPESTPPGPRPVIVTGFLGQNEPVTAVLEGGFHVLEPDRREPPPFPTEEGGAGGNGGGGVPFWLLLLLAAAVLITAGASAAILAYSLKQSSLKQAWQGQAQTQELPKSCQHCTYFVRREKIEFKSGRWKVTGLKVTMFDSARDRRDETREAPKDLVSKMDKVARQRLLHGEGKDLDNMINEMSRELTALVTAWQSISAKGKDCLVEAHLEGGSAEAKFARYHCVGQPGQWRKELEWRGTLKAADHLQSTFRGPMGDEPVRAYQVFLEGQLKEYLARVVAESARLL